MTLRLALVASCALLALAAAAPAAVRAADLRASVRVDHSALVRSWCEAAYKLSCQLAPTTGSTVSGRVLFTPFWKDGKCAVRIQAVVRGLTPMKKQAIHIHTYGDLALPTAVSLGGHFTSPMAESMAHGLPGSAKRHWGDFGSLDINEDGVATYDRVDDVISLPGIVGRGMVVHAKEDLGEMSQPSGGAGARKAMCVIGFANPDFNVWGQKPKV